MKCNFDYILSEAYLTKIKGSEDSDAFGKVDNNWLHFASSQLITTYSSKICRFQDKSNIFLKSNKTLQRTRTIG